jgi:hypothetical protein
VRRRLGLALVVCLVGAARVQAQSLPPDSAQCHYNDHLVTGVFTEHTHDDGWFPGLGRYPEVTGPFEEDFTQTLFHTSAFIGAFFVGNQKASDAQETLFYNDTGSKVKPVQFGNPSGVDTWGGHFTITPRIPHGWDVAESSIYTYFPDGATSVTSLLEPYHSMVDPSVPEPFVNEASTAIVADCRLDSPISGNNTYGDQTVAIESILPEVIAAPFTLKTSTYNYANGFAFQEPATTDVILDPDFHHGNNGTTIASVTATGDLVHWTAVLDPTTMGDGPHKVVVRRTQPNEGDSLATLMTFWVKVAAGAIVPPTCLPPAVLTNGQCVTPIVTPPPPPPPPPPTLLGIQMCAIETFSDGSVKNRCLDLP